MTQLRLALCALALTGGLWAGTASAQWPWQATAIARLEPGYGGVCEECDLSGRILAGAKMSNAVFNRSDFSHAVLTRANAAHTRFADVDFS
ncbi:MAG: pentapeptide repeat-containing protein, partial [Hyphomonadaceae bacterium]